MHIVKHSLQWTRASKDAIHALRDHFWTAFDIARNTGWKRRPALIDLLAKRRRKGFCESPDSFYTVGFINIRRGGKYRINIPNSSALYIAISLSSGKQQAVLELTRCSDSNTMHSQEITLADGVATGDSLDTSKFSGLTQLMIRQYFNNTSDSVSTPFPHIEYNKPLERDRLRDSMLPASILSGWYFLSWRLKTVLGIKFLQYYLGSNFPRNTFMTVEEIRDLWRSGHLTVSRLGINTFRYFFSIFDLKPGQILKISYRPNDSQYFAFSLNNSWMQGLDSTYHGTYINSKQLHEDVDGSYTIFVGDKNRGYKNFLDTKGYRRGLIHFREILSSDESLRPRAVIMQDGEDNA